MMLIYYQMHSTVCDLRVK